MLNSELYADAVAGLILLEHQIFEKTKSNSLQNNHLNSVSSRGGLGVERMLHKRHDSTPVDLIPLGALQISKL